MTEPKFQVGELLYWRQEVESWRDCVLPVLKKSDAKGYVSMGELGLHTHRPSRMQVLEILTQRCYGGVQVLYMLRRGDGTTFNLTEPELSNEPLEPAVGA